VNRRVQCASSKLRTQSWSRMLLVVGIRGIIESTPSLRYFLKKGARMVKRLAGISSNSCKYPGGAGLRTMTRYRSVRILVYSALALFSVLIDCTG